MRLLLDVNMSPLWVEYLEMAGHDVVHWTSVGDARADDVAITTYARQHNYIVFTRDLDFGAIMAASAQDKPSVLQLRGPQQLPNALGPRIVRLLEDAREELTRGAFVSIDLSKTRLRLLPFNPL